MFYIFHNGAPIGLSELEDGDPPMGCAEGEFLPLDEFPNFRETVMSEMGGDIAIKYWVGLSVYTQDKIKIDCFDAVLFEYDFGNHKELHVDAIGIDNTVYEELFPGRYAEYETSMQQ